MADLPRRGRHVWTEPREPLTPAKNAIMLALKGFTDNGRGIRVSERLRAKTAAAPSVLSKLSETFDGKIA